MLLRFLGLLVLFARSTVALNCHVCASRDFLGATIFPVLQSLGASMLIPPAGNCSDNAQICPTTSYCFKREDYYVFLDGSVAGTAHYYSKGCDINAVAGSTVAYEVNKCKQYDEKTASGYIVRRRICACNDKDLCNGGHSASVLSLAMILMAATLLMY